MTISTKPAMFSFPSVAETCDPFESVYQAPKGGLYLQRMPSFAYVSVADYMNLFKSGGKLFSSRPNSQQRRYNVGTASGYQGHGKWSQI